MIAMVNDERLQQLADECIHLSERTEDARTASELLRLSYRVLQLETPTLPTWQERVPETHWLPAPTKSINSIMQNAALKAKSYLGGSTS
jgi:hypothetical protein